MSFRPRVPHGAPRRRHHVVLFMALATPLVLSACGGGGGRNDDPSDRGAGGDLPSGNLPVTLDALNGDWVQQGCTRTGAQSYKRLLREAVTGPSTLDYSEGLLSYIGTDCAGTAQRIGPSRLGTVIFARSESNAGLVAHWGEFRTVTGTRNGAIWALRSSGLLCLLGDEIPSNQPSLSSVSASLNTIPAANCFSR